MADRKTINKYYPPDFDPSKLSRKAPKNAHASTSLATVRLMSPFSMRCTTCGEYIYKGKKFNARKQPTGETYLNSIKIIRFFIRCPRCGGEIKFKTDPKNAGYVTESGAERNLEPWRDREKEDETVEDRLVRLEEEERQAKEDEESGGKKRREQEDAFKELEAKVDQAKREMEIQDELEDLQMRNARHDEISKAAVEGIALPSSSRASLLRDKFEKEDAELAKSVFANKNRISTNSKSALASTASSVASTLIPTKVTKRKPNKLGIVRKKV
ncbi:similar to Saccharomyces cerevisiae YKL095W YJU2 Essential protein required for pre-mRNA splicing [Geotrichum candidum]|uniref:Splicing factor YJU2 n=1 Tax=Geotrichum candidum TaxID=1173061 RepID=A0A0J9XBD5_GEOCN|nr:similar to Saccharomyces cerevisiae YKL095W YJU2 Essential protein required for pre-mRNA splicing [Geotrichum candidum]